MRYSANAAFLAALHAKQAGAGAHPGALAFAAAQADYALGLAGRWVA